MNKEELIKLKPVLAAMESVHNICENLHHDKKDQGHGFDECPPDVRYSVAKCTLRTMLSEPCDESIIERLENEAVAWQVTVENLQGEVARYAEHLSFIERWANHHGAKSCHSAESVLGVIQHFPPITRITKSYKDGVVPDTLYIFA